MDWNLDLIKYWCSHYYALRDYELNPFQVFHILRKRSTNVEDVYVSGRQEHLAPYEETCDLNWEFDKALKKLGDKETIFRRIYLDGYDGSMPELYIEFCKILRENNEKNRP